MQDPLKQGLKLDCTLLYHLLVLYSNARSTKTRIETTDKTNQGVHNDRIRMQDPLKQGLKRSFISMSANEFNIRMQDPLKQGLKLWIVHSFSPCIIYSNARSTKTRIETPDLPLH